MRRALAALVLLVLALALLPGGGAASGPAEASAATAKRTVVVRHGRRTTCLRWTVRRHGRRATRRRCTTTTLPSRPSQDAGASSSSPAGDASGTSSSAPAGDASGTSTVPADGTTTPAPAATPDDAAGTTAAAAAAGVRDCANRVRAAAGLPALQDSPVLDAAAAAHAQDMAARDFFSHTSPDGGTLSSRVAAAAGGTSAFRALGENIAYGYPSAEAVCDGWMSSPGHRANLLSTSWTHVGGGWADGRWVQVFGRS